MARTRLDAHAANQAKIKKQQERKARGLPALMNPIEKSQENPQSLRKAIDAKCYECMGMLPSWRKDVAGCTSPTCPLFALRPGASK